MNFEINLEKEIVKSNGREMDLVVVDPKTIYFFIPGDVNQRFLLVRINRLSGEMTFQEGGEGP